MADDMGERTEEPTSKKRADARQRGQMAKSQDLAAAVIMLGATLTMAFLAPSIFRDMLHMTRHTLGPQGLEQATSFDAFMTEIGKIGELTVRVVVPVMLIMAGVAFVSQVVQVGLMFSTKPIEPTLSKFNIVKGVAKIFSMKSVVRGSLDLVKFTALTAAVIVAVRGYEDEMTALPTLTVQQAIELIAQILLIVAFHILAVLIVLGVLDFMYQKFQMTKDLRMSKHEVKDERKSMEGNPEVHARRMKIARQMAMQRMQQDVPQADVVVTNPTHVSVALKYDAESMHAPKVLCKGADYLALRIRQIAAAHDVPIVERPPLARALYAQCEVGDTIPEAEYEAVAEVLAYVYQIEGALRSDAKEAEAVA